MKNLGMFTVLAVFTALSTNAHGFFWNSKPATVETGDLCGKLKLSSSECSEMQQLLADQLEKGSSGSFKSKGIFEVVVDRPFNDYCREWTLIIRNARTNSKRGYHCRDQKEPKWTPMSSRQGKNSPPANPGEPAEAGR